MNFQDDIQNFIESLEQRPDFSKDMALKRVVQLLKEAKTQKDLQERKSLISRVAIDGIESWDTINLISTFMTSKTKS